MLADKAPKSRGSSFYIENLLGSPPRSPEVCAGRLDRNCKSARQRFHQLLIVFFVWSKSFGFFFKLQYFSQQSESGSGPRGDASVCA